IILLVAASLSAGALAAYATLRIWQEGARDEGRPAGAIVVLGAAQFDGRPSPVFAARLDHAIDLYLQKLAPILIVTGGKAEGDRTTEAATARTYALARGVPDSAIVLEDAGRTTYESLQAVARMLHGRGIRDAVFVSDPTHMLRVLRMAGDLGIVSYGSPTPTSRIESDPAEKLDATIHELGALAYYLFFKGSPVEDAGSPRPAR
ncbi:MAG: YdcF family protein, partial [Chloroflexota bacterium]|nr:YdcF family protein [Chloroflexota bacterium]